ncbi:hypothetical protein Tco_0224102 [Tanacetum coccineum]
MLQNTSNSTCTNNSSFQPVSTIPDIQPTLPPSPQIPSPSYHDTEGPSFEPSYHMSPPPSHEPEIQASRSSEETQVNTAEVNTAELNAGSTPSAQVNTAEVNTACIITEQRSAIIRNKPPTISQLRNQMITYLKHVANKKHAELKSKSFEEIQVLYERYKKQDQTFVAIGSEEDERSNKKMNEKDADKEKK